MLAASPPEGCSTNNNDAPGFKVLGTYSMKVRSRPPTVLTWRVASPIGSAATAVATSANAAPIVQCGSVVSAMISRLRFTRAYHTPAKRYVRHLDARPPCIFHVVQSGSTAKAAAQLRVKQPSVSDRSRRYPTNDLRRWVDRMRRRGVRSIEAGDRKNRVPVRSDHRRGEDWVRAVQGGRPFFHQSSADLRRLGHPDQVDWVECQNPFGVTGRHQSNRRHGRRTPDSCRLCCGAASAGQFRTHAVRETASSFDHLVGERQELVRHVEPERLGGLEVDHEFEFSRAASVAATLRRRSTSASSITPLSEDSRPPSNTAVTFLRETDGRLKLSRLSSIMAGVAAWLEAQGGLDTHS